MAAGEKQRGQVARSSGSGACARSTLAGCRVGRVGLVLLVGAIALRLFGVRGWQWALVAAGAGLVVAGVLLRRGARSLLAFALTVGSVAAGCLILARYPQSLWLRALALLCFAAAVAFAVLGAALQSAGTRRPAPPAADVHDDRPRQADPGAEGQP